MSTERKDSRGSPKSASKAKSRGKDALRKSSSPTKSSSPSPTKSSTRGFDLGLAIKESVKDEGIQRIMSVQNKSLKNFAKTNELLGQFNDFSSSKYAVLQHMFLQHTQLLVDLKKGLTNVFLRIRRLKVRLQQQHPEAFEATFNLRQDLEDRLEKEEAAEPTYTNHIKDKSVSKKVKTTKNKIVDSNESAAADKDESVAGNENESEQLDQNESVGAEKENNDSNLEFSEEENAMAKKEFSENYIKHDMHEESERTAEGDMSCGHSDSRQTDLVGNEQNEVVHMEVKRVDNVPEENQGKDEEEAQEIKVVTEGVKECLVVEGDTEHNR